MISNIKHISARSMWSHPSLQPSAVGFSAVACSEDRNGDSWDPMARLRHRCLPTGQRRHAASLGQIIDGRRDSRRRGRRGRGYASSTVTEDILPSDDLAAVQRSHNTTARKHTPVKSCSRRRARVPPSHTDAHVVPWLVWLSGTGDKVWKVVAPIQAVVINSKAVTR